MSKLGIPVVSAVICGCWLLLACEPQGGGQSGAEIVDEPGEPVVPDQPVDPSPGGQGPEECEDAAVCVEQVESELASFSEPSSAPSIRDQRCDFGGVMLETVSASGSYCECEHDDGRTSLLGPVGLGCYLYGRAGDCLFSDADFSGCDRDDDASCEASCQLLEDRLAADAAQTFDTEVLEAICDGGRCTSVVRVGERCFVDGSYEQGRGYSCDEGADDIRQQYEADTAPPELIELPPADANYLPNTNGSLFLIVSTVFHGTHREEPYFSARADFVTVEGSDGVFGEVIDPLEGIDDCGVTQTGGVGVGASVEWQQADHVTLIDEEDEYDFEQIDVGFTFYGLGLTDIGVQPRFGERYGFSASGASLSGNFETDQVQLPLALEFDGLASLTHLPRGEVELTWSGSNEAPLALRLSIVDTLSDAFYPYDIDCLVRDDGQFTIPAEVLEAAPEGFVSVRARRRSRQVVEDGDNAFLLEGEVAVEHDLAFGEPCETPEVLAACIAHVEAERELRAECGGYDPALEPPMEVQCPDYLASACNGCVEFFECQTENTRCENGGVVYYSGCSCSP